MIGKRKTWLSVSWIFMVLFMGQAEAQVRSYIGPPRAANVIVPQSRAFSVHQAGGIEITGVEAGVVILEQVATTTMDIEMENRSGRRQEAELLVPVPDGAVVKKFSFQGEASEPTAQILFKNEAKKTYEAIVMKIRDPALLEFAGYNLIRTSVFPIEARGRQKVRLTCEHLLQADGNRVDYILPRTESIDYQVPWKISVKIKSRRPISTVYSPSHEIETIRRNENIISARLATAAATEPGPFRLSYLVESNGVSATLYSYPDPKVGGGYFLLLAGLPASIQDSPEGRSIKREVTLVLDRSGSMNGEKLEQVKEAAFQVLEGLEDGEAFRLIVYSDSIDVFSREPMIKSRESVKRARAYIEGIRATGGTNIHDALLEALRQEPAKDMLPIVIFLTDGLPTIGQTSEAAIRELAQKANRFHRRVFTFGVGVDVNAPLLDKVASESRATSTYVLPGEDVEVKVAQVFKRLFGPVLASPALEVVDEKGKPTEGRVRELLPVNLPDLFEDDQLVLLGKYTGDEPLGFMITGNYLGRNRKFKFDFDLDDATTRNSFVPRLWASRKIAMLVDAIRQSGADVLSAGGHLSVVGDPRVKELVDEVVRLSREFGILTEYTSFLATEGTDLSNHDQVLAQATHNFEARAINTRSGMAAVNQSFNNDFMATQSVLNTRNAYVDPNLNRVSITNVQQVNDLSFFNRRGQWVDSRVVHENGAAAHAKEVEFGSPEFRELMSRLSRENRQGVFMLRGDVLMQVDGETVLIKAPVGR